MTIYIFIIISQFVVWFIVSNFIALFLVYRKGGKLNFTISRKKDLFSADVMDVYAFALYKPEAFTFSGHVVDIAGSDISLWASNKITSRRFYTSEDCLDSKVEEMNRKISFYDKILLNKVCEAVKKGQLENLEIYFDIIDNIH